MIAPFDQMPESSRLWIYQAERSLSKDEQVLVQQVMNQFINDWTAHGSDLMASFDLLHDQFLIITLDENHSEASGCSIDSSVRIIKALEQELEISFMNNSKVAFLIDNQVQLFPFNVLKQSAQDQVITKETQVFDNTIRNFGEFKSRWLAPSGETWVGRYFK